MAFINYACGVDTKTAEADKYVVTAEFTDGYRVLARCASAGQAQRIMRILLLEERKED